MCNDAIKTKVMSWYVGKGHDFFYIIYIFSKIKDKMKMVSGLNKKASILRRWLL